VLHIGCGNGALLRALAGRIQSGVGVDRSHRLLWHARRRVAPAPDGAAPLSFVAIDGPALPFADASFDVVVSLLSFRYLDWDPVMNEIRRVLAPGGRLLVVDMVTAPLRAREVPAFARTKARQLLRHCLPGAQLLDPADAVVDWLEGHWPLAPGGPADLVATTGSAASLRRAARVAFGVELGEVATVRRGV